MKHEESELKKKQADLKSTAKGYEKDKVAFEAMKKDLLKIEVCFSILAFSHMIL